MSAGAPCRAFVLFPLLVLISCRGDVPPPQESQPAADEQQGSQPSVNEQNRQRLGIDGIPPGVDGEAFLAATGAMEGVITMESGLQYQVLREGEGLSPESGQSVIVHYLGIFPDGTEFDASYGGPPADFGIDQLISGFAEALKLMKPGGHLRVFIPSDLAYGSRGMAPGIGPDQVLIFEIELLSVRA